MRDQRKVFAKLLEKDEKLKKIKSNISELSPEDIEKLPLPLWQRKMFLELKNGNKMLDKMKYIEDNFEVVQQDIWAGTLLKVYVSKIEFWLQQSSGKENLINTGDMIAVEDNNIFWGHTVLKSCINLHQLLPNSEYKGEYSKDDYFALYKNHITSKNPVVDEVIDLTGNNSREVSPVLSQYGVRIGK